MKTIVKTVHKRDFLSVISKIYQIATGLLSMQCGLYETFKDFEL